MSTDHLFHVRAKQPFSTNNLRSKTTPVSTEHPTVCCTVEIGNLCAFRSSETIWKIGNCCNLHITWKKEEFTTISWICS